MTIRKRSLRSMLVMPSASSASSCSSHSAAMEKVQALCQQEQTVYSNSSSCAPRHYFVDIDNNASAIDPLCRQKMIQWCLDIADACSFSLETVEYAVRYLDRFLSKDAQQDVVQDRNVFQLATMTSLYLASKIHEYTTLSSLQMATVSGGKFTPQQVERMEARMLFALEWKLHGPTTCSFVAYLQDCLSSSCKQQQQQQRVQAHSMIAASLLEASLICVPPSELAYAILAQCMQQAAVCPLATFHSLFLLQQALGRVGGCSDYDTEAVVAELACQESNLPLAPSVPLPEEDSCHSSSNSKWLLDGPSEHSPRSVSESYTDVDDLTPVWP